jgi:hypothetical protein
MTKEIELTRGFVALVDDEDFEYLSQFKWYAVGKGYAVHSEHVKGKRPYRVGMHRLVLVRKLGRELTPSEEPDHVDRNPTNNTRQNLRASTHKQNSRNKTKVRTSTTSKFKGVYYSKKSKKWNALIRINQKLFYLGSFDFEESAARAYDAAARKHFGEFANLNFPDKEYSLVQVLKTECKSRYGNPRIY